MVVVTINYRLGALGFLRLTDATDGRIPSTGNEGLLDQIARARMGARQHRSASAAIPTNVTIFGESAGGMSVGALLGAPRARGLFKRAIPQSGASSTATPARVQSTQVAEGFLKHLQLKPNDIASLETMDAQALTMAGAGYTLVAGGMPYQPCIDGELLPALPIETVKDGNADGVSVLVGAAAHEWLLFSAMDPAAATLDDGHLQRACRRPRWLVGGPMHSSTATRRCSPRAVNRTTRCRCLRRSRPTACSGYRDCALPKRSRRAANRCTTTSSRGVRRC